MIRQIEASAGLRAAPLVCLLALASAAVVVGGEAPYLLTLEGPPATVRYSPGSLDRADRVQRRLVRLVTETGRRRQGQQLVVAELLHAAEWRQSGLAEPYGLPAISGTGALALPAWGEPATVALWRGLLDGWLPSSPGTPLRGTPEEAASLEAADLVGEVEASRIILAKLGLTGGQPWVDDLLACTLAVSAVMRSEPGRWAEVRQLHTRLAARPEAARDERLRRLRWVAAAERIGSETDKIPTKPLLKLVNKSKGPLAAETLLERFPWLAEMRAAGRAN